MNKNKYLLELSAEEAIMLHTLIKDNMLYQSTYEPLQSLITKIRTIVKDIK